MVKALRDARMPITIVPRDQIARTAMQQFTCCLNALMDAMRLSSEERFYFISLIERDNFIARDNPFKDDSTA